tara:strand:- start:8680 stop:8838 length:159 start_codon:yes stop_codon:yes gene_type:complete
MPKYKVNISFDEQTITADSEDEAQEIAVENADFGWANIEVDEITKIKQKANK